MTFAPNNTNTSLINTKPELLTLKKNPFQAPQFFYPRDLGTVGQEPYIIFDIRKAVARNQGGQSLGTIALYMPPEVKTSYHMTYEDDAINFAKYLARWRDIFGPGGMAGAIQAGFETATQIIDQRTQLGLESLRALKQGFVINPHQSVIFRGVQFRKFNFSFVFQPRNAKESEDIQNIIYKFKYHMHPALKGTDDSPGTRQWYFPDNFVIGLFSPADRYLFKISVCVLTDMDVDYAGGSQVPSFFAKTGAPVDVRLTLHFSELEQLSKDRIFQGF